MRKMIKKVIPDFIIKAYRNYKEHKKIKSYQREMVFYAGDKVFCPICKSRFEKFADFAPFGRLKRKNVRCIECDALERHRLLFLYLSNNTNVFDGDAKLRLLHFAPEKGF